MGHDRDCQERLGKLSEYIDGTAKESVCREIEEHLESCPDCRIMVDTMRKTITLYREQELEVAFPEQARRRLYRRLDLDDLLRTVDDQDK
jgi:predicted anti-sigma-YlaC factor YlaD